MGHTQFRWIYSTLEWCRRFALALSAFIGLLLKADPAKIGIHVSSSAQQLVVYLQTNAWIYVPILIVLAWLVGQLKARVGDPATWDELQKVLTDFRNGVFSDAGSGYEAHRRATFFKYTRWSIGWGKPWGRSLVAVLRSGTTTHECSTAFSVSRDSFEGIAGRAWVSERVVYIENLPDMQATNCTDEQRKSYAAATHVTVERILKKPPQAQSFYATRVEVAGKAWGVLVLDSKQPTINKRRADSKYKEFVDTFPLLLRRI